MLKELLKNKKFYSIIEEGLKKEDILDIILFGSVIRGKDEPKDIDLIILYAFKNNINFSYELRKKLEKEGFKVDITSISYKELLSPNFLGREGILFEGFSFKLNKYLSAMFGFSGFMLFKYYLEGMNNSERMTFYYTLHGRGKEKGILESFDSYKFSDNFIIAPVNNVEKISDFLERRKIKFVKIPVLIPHRLASKKFLSEHEK
ncbi:MAG: nucleotidyltransferase domain-containing protein [Nanoarchaeota archaeon]